MSGISLVLNVVLLCGHLLAPDGGELRRGGGGARRRPRDRPREVPEVAGAAFDHGADGKPADILSWWKQRDHSLPADPQTNRPEGLPRLVRMARQYHNEPATSAGAEWLFSAASRAHHDLKGAMNDNSLEHELLALANTD